MAATNIIRALRPPSAAASVHGRPPRSADALPWLAAAGVVGCVASVTVAAAVARASPEAAFGRGLLQALLVAVPIVVGLAVLRTPGSPASGAALLGTGFAWSLAILAEVSGSVPQAIGRAAAGVVFCCVAYLLLTFGDGRIPRGLERILFCAVAVLTFAVVSGTASPSQVVLAGGWLVVVLWAGLCVSMCQRWRAASPLQRQAMGPVFLAGALLGACTSAYVALGQLDAPAATVNVMSLLWAFSTGAVCAALGTALLRRRLLLGSVLARLSAAQRLTDDPRVLRDLLAAALRDPALRLAFRDQRASGWHDERGRGIPRPEGLAAGRAATTVGVDGDVPVAVLVHDVALREDPELLDGISGLVLSTWRREQLLRELGEAMAELADSRRRIAEAADLERVRIERDLHDGAQQRLIALRIGLELAAEKLRHDPAAGLRDVQALGGQAELAIDDLRSLAHGIYPALLTDRGLPDALRAIGAHSPLAVGVIAHGVTRQPIEIESALYFVCVEAVQNAIKHAAGATAVRITLRQSARALHFAVRDDGCGLRAGTGDGRGLRNMRDRIEAIGGRVTIEGARGRGTHVFGAVDVPSAR